MKENIPNLSGHCSALNEKTSCSNLTKSTICPGLAAGAVCARCAAGGPTCCSLGAVSAEAEEPQCFPLSEPEASRILAEPETSRLPRPFTSTPNSPAFLVAMRALFPGEEATIAKIWPEQANHLRLHLPNGRDCVFLGPQGCLLPPPARPWFCRLFPFWVLKGRPRCFAPANCLAVREKPSLNGLFGTFAQDKAEVLTLYSQLRRDWGLDKR